MALLSSPRTLVSCVGEDVLRIVFRDLSRADKSALCLIDRETTAVVQPVLFQSIALTWSLKPRPPFLALAHTLSRRKDLSMQVRDLTLLGDGYRNQYADREKRGVALSEAELEMAITMIDSADVEFVNCWISAARAGKMSAFTTLLLLHTPRLRSLKMQSNFNKDKDLPLQLIKASLQTPSQLLHQFHYLEHVVHLLTDRDESRWSIDRAASMLLYFYLPSLSTISVSLEKPASIDWPLGPPKSVAVTSLRLTSIREHQLASLLRVMNNLKSLTWEWYYLEGLETSSDARTIDLNAISTAISVVSTTLQKLSIVLTAEIDLRNYDFPAPPLTIIGSTIDLSNCHKLTSLTMPAIILKGVGQPTELQLKQVVPSTVEELTLTDDLHEYKQFDYLEDENGFVRDLIQSLSQLGELGENLRKVVLSGRYDLEPAWSAVNHISFQSNNMVDLEVTTHVDWSNL